MPEGKKLRGIIKNAEDRIPAEVQVANVTAQRFIRHRVAEAEPEVLRR